jgi:hypothetical protein
MLVAGPRRVLFRRVLDGYLYMLRDFLLLGHDVSSEAPAVSAFERLRKAE